MKPGIEVITHAPPRRQKKIARLGAGFRKKIPAKALVHFTRDLAIMLNARMMLVESMSILARQDTHHGFQKMVEKIGEQLKGGAAFADCLRPYPRVFNAFYINLVEVGELTGALGEMLNRVAVYLEKIADLKRKLIQALTYPVLVIGVAVASLSFIMLYVIPTFSGIFRDFNAELPWPTLVVLSISKFIQTHLFHFFVGLFMLVLFVRYSQSVEKIRRFRDGVVLKLPLLGELVRKNHISQFCRTLGTLLEGGVSLLKALDIASRSTENHYIRQDILSMKHFASKGEKLTRSLQKSHIFPLMVTRMLAVGEETAELPFMLLKISDFYDKEIDSAIETLASVIEPIVIVVLGVIIGAILISIYLPLFNMTEVMGG